MAIFTLYSCELNASTLDDEGIDSTGVAGAVALKFDQLPAEVVTNIFRHLPPRDWFNFSGTCKYCRALVFNEVKRNITMQEYLLSIVHYLHYKPPSFPAGWDEVWKARMGAKFLSYAVLNTRLVEKHGARIVSYMRHLEQFRDIETFKKYNGHLFLDQIHQQLPGLKGALLKVPKRRSRQKYSWGPLALLAVPVAIGGFILYRVFGQSDSETTSEFAKFAAVGAVGTGLLGTQLLGRKKYEKSDEDL